MSPPLLVPASLRIPRSLFLPWLRFQPRETPLLHLSYDVCLGSGESLLGRRRERKPAPLVTAPTNNRLFIQKYPRFAPTVDGACDVRVRHWCTAAHCFGIPPCYWTKRPRNVFEMRSSIVFVGVIIAIIIQSHILTYTLVHPTSSASTKSCWLAQRHPP